MQTGELMSRNFGLGSRNMKTAGKFALKNATKNGGISFSTAGTVAERWHTFAAWAENNGAKKMEDISQDLAKKYGCELAEKVNAGKLTAATAQVYVSAVNTVMSIATKREWKSISPTLDCVIPKRCAIRLNAPSALNRMVYNQALKEVKDVVGARVAALIELTRELGLRSKEASLLDAREVQRKAKLDGAIVIINGTKGGRERIVPITKPDQFQALQHAALTQGEDRSMIPGEKSWKNWRSCELRKAREIIKKHTNGGLHDLRAAYACQRYHEETGHAAPAAGGIILDKTKDMNARLTIAKELGHGRADVVSEYIGGRR